MTASNREEFRSLSDAFADSSEPKTIKQLQRETEVSQEELEGLVKRAVEQGAAFQHPPKQRNHGLRFSSKSIDQFLLEKIEAHLKGVSTKAKLRSLVPVAYRDSFDRSIGKGIAEGRLFSWRKGNSQFLSRTPPSLRDLLTKGEQVALRTIAKKLQNSGRPQITVEVVTGFLETTPPPKLNPADLRIWYDTEAHRLSGTKSMRISWLWDHYRIQCKDRGSEPDLVVFQDALREMADTKVIVLANHDAPQMLPKEEASLPFRYRGISHAFYLEFID